MKTLAFVNTKKNSFKFKRKKKFFSLIYPYINIKFRFELSSTEYEVCSYVSATIIEITNKEPLNYIVITELFDNASNSQISDIVL
jgi:hypothetical protein